MSDTARRWFNASDSLFDRRAITREQRFSQAAGNVPRPITARQAYAHIQPLARRLDRGARLTLIVSQSGVDADGASPHWEFCFDLPARRATLVAEWVLPWDESADDYGPVQIDVTVRPFPAEAGLLRQMVQQGKLLHRQLESLWKQEYRKRPALPEGFRDSSAALADFIRQGLDASQTEFALSSGLSPEGAHCWLAQTRHRTYYAPLE